MMEMSFQGTVAATNAGRKRCGTVKGVQLHRKTYVHIPVEIKSEIPKRNAMMETREVAMVVPQSVKLRLGLVAKVILN